MNSGPFALSKNFLFYFMISVIERRFVGSFCKQSLTNCLNSGVHSSNLGRSGGGELIITKSTLIAGNSELGASPIASSRAVIPKDQISALKS